MLRLLGIAVSPEDSRTLVDLLLRSDTAAAVSAAQRIELGVARGSTLVGLEAAERDALFGVLDDPPETLAELRGALARDLAARHGGEAA